MKFTAITLDQRRLKTTDALSARPCGGICSAPSIDFLDIGDIRKYDFPLAKQIYISPKGRDLTLDVLLGSCSLQASFEVTTQQLKDAGLSLKYPWIGHLTTPELAAKASYPDSAA